MWFCGFSETLLMLQVQLDATHVVIGSMMLTCYRFNETLLMLLQVQ